MSINNPYGLNPGWKIDPDGRQDRRPSEVTIRQMTEEERQKYGAVKGQPIGPVISFIKSEEVKQIREREKMGRGHKLNVNTEDLLRICRIHGTGIAGYKAVAAELGMSWHTAKKKVAERGIVKMLRGELAWVKSGNKLAVEENRLATESVGFDAGETMHCVTGEKCPRCGGATAETNKGKRYCLSTDCRLILPATNIKSHEEHPETVVYNFINQPFPIETEDAELYKKGFIGKQINEVCPECGKLLLETITQYKWCETEGCQYTRMLHPELFTRNEEQINKAIKEYRKSVSKPPAFMEMHPPANIKHDVDEMMEMVPDCIINPPHYLVGGIETMDFIKAKLTSEGFEGFCIGSIIQYVSRYRHKGGLDDLKKAEQVLQRIISVKESA